jgi:uncharacterized protein
MYIQQRHLETLKKTVMPNRVVVVIGPRRVGKTTLVKKYLEGTTGKGLYVTGDDIIVREHLESQSVKKLSEFIGSNTLLVIDEAQYINRIGLNLKLIVDNIPGISIIATGSSSFELAHDIGEPLTGRKRTLTVFPLAQMEIASIEERHETAASLETRLLYGAYPEVVITPGGIEKKACLRELVNAYLFKDILALEGIRNPEKLTRLLQLLAFQIGKEVSISELGTHLGMSKNTVARYLDLLEKVFVIFRRSGFSRNLRNELTKNHRFYFVDNGVRNTVIDNFNSLSVRDDTGMLWENYIIGERVKRLEYTGEQCASYFWRTYDQKEIDLVEDREGKLSGYEIKWSPRRTAPPQRWLASYPGAGFSVIHQDNYLEFIT